MENQPSSSLISLSPLTTSHFRALLRSRMRSLRLASRDLLVVRSLDFGCDRAIQLDKHGRLADPLYKRYEVAFAQSTDFLLQYFNTFQSSLSVLFQPSFTVLVFYRSPYTLHVGARISVFNSVNLPTIILSKHAENEGVRPVKNGAV